MMIPKILMIWSFRELNVFLFFLILCFVTTKYRGGNMDKLKEFKSIMEKSDTDKLILVTSHYKISGYVYDCEECNKEHFINLTNASLCFIDANYPEECTGYTSINYDWLHVNLDNVIAFSFLK